MANKKIIASNGSSGALLGLSSDPRRAQNYLNLLFFVPLALRLLFWIVDQRSWLLSGTWRTKNYGVTEWMINYQGGFVRRGLPGEILFRIGKHTGIDIGWTVLCLSLALYCVYFVLLLREARGSFPAWALYSAPILGFPVYSNDIIRKDILLLLLLFATVKIISRVRVSPCRQCLLGAISTVGLLSHELYLFLAIPVCLFADVRSSWKQLSRTRVASFLSLIAIGWLPPLIATVLVFRSSGSNAQAVEILSSWSVLNPAPTELIQTLPGSVAWLGRTPQDTIRSTHYLLSLTHFGFPLWALVAMAIALAATAITLLFKTQEKRRNFTLYALVQLASMLPIYFSATDQGRWIFLTFNSAMIFSLCFSIFRSNAMLRTIQAGIESLRLAVSPIFCVLALLIWGFPLLSWSVYEWIVGNPLTSIPAKIYVYLREHNAIPKLL